MNYEQRSMIERRAFSLDGKSLRFQHRNFWGTLTVELVIPLSELRPEISRMWVRDEKMQQLIGISVLVFYGLGTAYGLSREGQLQWALIKFGMAFSLLLTAIALVLVTKRFEHAMLYYRNGTVAGTIGRQGPEADRFTPFVDELAKQIAASTAPGEAK